jgi:hypothetical protein
MSDNTSMKFKCEDIQPLLTDYMSRELGPYKSDVVREHLRKCESCKAAVQELDIAMSALKTLPKSEDDKIPKRLSARSRRRITWTYKHPFLAWLDSNQVYIISIMLILLMVGMVAFFLDARADEEPDFSQAIEVNLGPPGMFGEPNTNNVEELLRQQLDQLPDELPKEEEPVQKPAWFYLLLIAVLVGAGAIIMRMSAAPVDINDKEPDVPPGNDDGPSKSD